MSETFLTKDVHSLKKEIDFEKVQQLHCEEAMCNNDICSNCIFYPDNLREFKVWFKKKEQD